MLRLPSPMPRAHSTADVGVTSPTATRMAGAAAATDAATASRATPIRRREWSVTGLRGNRRLQICQNLVLELLDALTEGAAEVAVTVLAARERAEVFDHPVEAIALDEVIRHQERQLVGGQRALLAVAHGESPRGAERLEIEAGGDERRVIADAGPRDRAAALYRVHPEALEDAEGDPLRHPFGQPLLGEALTLGELDLTDVGHLVGDQAEPLAAGPVGALVVEEELAPLADTDGEIGQLGGARGRDVGVVDESLLEHAPGVVDEDGHLLGHRQVQITDEDGADSPHGLLVRRHHPRIVGKRERAWLDRHGHDEAATPASRDERDDEEDEQPEVSRRRILSTFFQLGRGILT